MTALVTEKLPLLAAAPNGILSLRALILDLAVRGRLCKQDLADQDAATLLACLKSEQVSNKPTGKRRGVAAEGAATPETQFELPIGWSWATIADLAEVVRGVTYGKADARDEPGAGLLPLLRGNNINGTLNFDKLVYVPASLVSDEQMVRAGDLVIAMSSGSADLVGKAAQAVQDFQGGFGAFCGVVRPKSAELHRYLGFFFKTPFYRRSAAGQGKGIGINNLQKTALLALSVPVPPLAEQHRIVAKVDELMALCDRLQAEQVDAEAAHAKLVGALLASLTQARDAADFRASWQQLAEHFHTLFTTEASVDALKQSIVHLAVMGKLVAPAEAEASASDFLADVDAARAEYEAMSGLRTRQRADQGEVMVPPPYPAPAGWEWRNLGSLLHITGGVTLGRKLAGRALVSLPYLRVANVQRGFLVLDQVKEIEVPVDEVEKYKLASGDLLTTEGGDWDKVGRTAIWRGEIAQCLHQNHVFRSRPYTDKFSSRWVELYLNSAPAREYFAGSSKQTTNLASINMTQLRACALPVPPLAEQQRIVALVDDLVALCDQLKVELAEVCRRHEQVSSLLVMQAAA